MADRRGQGRRTDRAEPEPGTAGWNFRWGSGVSPDGNFGYTWGFGSGPGGSAFGFGSGGFDVRGAGGGGFGWGVGSSQFPGPNQFGFGLGSNIGAFSYGGGFGGLSSQNPGTNGPYDFGRRGGNDNNRGPWSR